MSKFGSSQPVRRLEDTRFITGHGRYIDDTVPEGALRSYVLRSPMAHGRITTLDVNGAREAPGVALVLTGADIVAHGLKNAIAGSTVNNQDGTKGAAPGAADPRGRPGCATWASRSPSSWPRRWRRHAMPPS
jgi:carbon-monoxide dehydrogenase large subunit